MRQHSRCLLLFLILAIGVTAQTESNMPPNPIFELLDKADQKVSGFEDALRATRPNLDSINPEYSRNYLKAASFAHTLIRTLHENGPSAYRLVAILATLDDLSLDAAKAALVLSVAEPPVNGRATAVLLLSSASEACNDISELIFHLTLRYVHTEEVGNQK